MIKKLLSGWDRFWFEETSPLPLAAFRIGYGLVVLTSIILLVPDLFVWFGRHGMVSPDSVYAHNYRQILNLLNFANDSDSFLVLFVGIYALAAVSFILGFQTRLSSIVIFLLMTSLHRRQPMIWHGGDNFMRLISFWLMFSRAGDALSIDALLRRRNHQPQPVHTPWAQRFIQVQMALVYLHAVVSKLMRGEEWFMGTAIYYSSHLLEFKRFPVPFVFDQSWTSMALSWGTLFTETALFTLIWWRPTRNFALLLGLIMHLGIDYSMNIPLFAWVMICTYVLFLDGRDLEIIQAKLKGIIFRGKNVPGQSNCA